MKLKVGQRFINKSDLKDIFYIVKIENNCVYSTPPYHALEEDLVIIDLIDFERVVDDEEWIYDGFVILYNSYGRLINLFL